MFGVLSAPSIATDSGTVYAAKIECRECNTEAFLELFNSKQTPVAAVRIFVAVVAVAEKRKLNLAKIEREKKMNNKRKKMTSLLSAPETLIYLSDSFASVRKMQINFHFIGF